MTQEEKDLLMKDISARVFYGVQVQVNIPYVNVDFDKDYNYITNSQNNCVLTLSNISEIQKMTDDIKPYLRPLSSITKEELDRYEELEWTGDLVNLSIPLLDWLNKNMFDYRGLIEKGLAIEAPEGMYKTKE